jgi:BirA family biotin operon repressor/biotin-[acetyl-CoA-carboxylase] ligase
MQDLFSGYLADLERSRPGGPDRGPENLVVVRSIGSTNRLARDIVAEYEREAQPLHPLLILAWEQSGGRGRQGRSWVSAAGKGVYASRVVAAGEIGDVEVLQSLPLLVGVGLCRGLARTLPVPCRLKWPNDLVVETAEGRRKIGGILIEAMVRPGEAASAIVGFGVNHGQTDGELPETGTSLHMQQGGAPLAQLTWDLVSALERELAHLGDVAYAVASYRELTVHRPGEAVACRVGEAVIEGRFLGFDERGRLLLDRDGEELRLTAGEVIE